VWEGTLSVSRISSSLSSSVLLCLPSVCAPLSILFCLQPVLSALSVWPVCSVLSVSLCLSVFPVLSVRLSVLSVLSVRLVYLSVLPLSALSALSIQSARYVTAVKFHARATESNPLSRPSRVAHNTGPRHKQTHKTPPRPKDDNQSKNGFPSISFHLLYPTLHPASSLGPFDRHPSPCDPLIIPCRSNPSK